jgi:hypothetical protein
MLCRVFRISCIILNVLLFLPMNLLAADLDLKPSLALSARYDDNIDFSRTDPIDDYSSIIQPIIILDYQTERSRLSAGADVSFVNYL